MAKLNSTRQSEKLVRLVYIDNVAIHDNDHNQGKASAKVGPINFLITELCLTQMNRLM
jgi:hypothetical protein